MVDDKNWTSSFEETFATPVSLVMERIWQEVLGSEYLEGLDAFSYISVTELRRFADEVQVGADQYLVDIGCGRGGPGLWVAAMTGARLIGIDVADSALAAARRRADEVGLAGRAEYRRGSFEDTDLSDRSANAVMSVDALLFSPDKSAAIVEMARIIVPGGRLVLTSWDYHSQPGGLPSQVDDHRPLLTEAGFDLLNYEETAAWRERIQQTNLGLLAAVDELAVEFGADPAEIKESILEMDATFAHMSRRVLLVARRRTG